MAYDRFIHHRKSIRVKGFDYTQPGAYYITIVAFRRLPIFGEITGTDMHLNTFGQIARVEWMKTTAIRHEIELDEFVVMPNHFHAIVTIVECDGGSVGARRRRAPTIEQFSKPIAGSIPTIIRAYKSAVTTRINQIRGTPGAPIWQRNYWVVRAHGRLPSQRGGAPQHSFAMMRIWRASANIFATIRMYGKRMLNITINIEWCKGGVSPPWSIAGGETPPPHIRLQRIYCYRSLAPINEL